MDDLADVVSGALGVNRSAAAPRPEDFPSNGRVPDAYPRAILASERAAAPNDPNIQREIQLRFPDMAGQPAPSQPAAASPPANPDAFDPAVVIDALNHSSAPAPAAKPGALEETYNRVTGFPVGAAQVVANQATAIGHQIMGGWRGLAAIASGAGLDEAVRQVENPELAGGATARTYQPPAGSDAAKITDALASKYNPMNIASVAGAKAGDLTYEATGSPAAATAVETGVNAIPLLLIRGGKGEAAPRPEPKLVGSSSIADVQKPAQITSEPNYDVPTVIRRRAAQPVEASSSETPAPAAKAAAAPASGPAIVQEAPTPEAAAKVAEDTAPKFSEAPPPAVEGKTLPPAAQAERAAVLQRIGLTDARSSAITGDAKAASTDFQTSKVDNSAGNYMRGVLDNERAALSNHAENIVRDTGGSIGTDEPSLLARGQTILSPLEAFKQWFTDKTNGLYTEARNRMGDQPVALDSFSSALRQDSSFAQQNASSLRAGIAARMKELGMADNDGQTLGNVQQVEELRKYIGEQWQPGLTDVVRNLKQSLDNDVTSSAGQDVFRQARALHAMKQSIFADPKGLSSILDSEGINRQVPIEKIPDKIAALPNAQFAHIVKTLQTVPPELAPQAQAALAEIKAQFANRMRDAGIGPNGHPVPGGSWRARDVTTYLNKNAAKMQLVFSPEEMAKIHDLNDAGHILAKDTSYPGAVVQGHNLLQRGALATLPKAGAVVGATLGTLFGAPGTGALVGETAGARLAGKMGDAAGLRAAQKRVVKLGEFPK